jgi:hypothetical protein
VQTLTKVEDSWLTPEGAQFCNKQIQAKIVNKLGRNGLFPNTRSLTFNTEEVFTRITSTIVWPPAAPSRTAWLKGGRRFAPALLRNRKTADFGGNTALLWVAMPIAPQELLPRRGDLRSG